MESAELAGFACGSSRGVLMIGRLKVVSKSDLVLDEVALGHLKTRNLSSFAPSDAAGTANNGTRHHERA